MKELLSILINHGIAYRIDTNGQLWAYSDFVLYDGSRPPIIGIEQTNVTNYTERELKEWLGY